MNKTDNRTYAALADPAQPDGYRFVEARKHVYHANREAATRAISRVAVRLGGAQRGFTWPAWDALAMHERRWEVIDTIAF